MNLGLGVQLGKLKLSTPIVCASGTFGFGGELKGLVDFGYVGGVTTKTITLSPSQGNPPPRIYETDCGVINAIGLENPGVDGFIKKKLPLLKGLKSKRIISVGGFSFSEYEKALRKLSTQKEIDAFEINLSCPNLKLKKIISQSHTSTYKIVKSLRKLTKKPLFIKITPEVTDIVKIAKTIEEAGADAISLVNTFFSMAINIDTRKPYLGNVSGGYSGRAIKPLALYRVWKVAQNIKIPIIGGGGIENAADAIEFILAGATAVSIGTVNLVSPNRAKSIVKGISEYMKVNKIKNISKIRGGIIV